MKRILTLEHVFFFILCFVSVFGYSTGMTDPYIIPKWCFTGLVFLLGIMMLLVKRLLGKALYWDVLICSYIIGGICIFQSLYGIVQWFQIILLEHNCKVVGSFDNPTGFSACLCSGFPFVFLCLKTLKGNKQRIVGGLSIFIIVLAIVMSESRSGMIVMAVFISFVLYKHIRFNGMRKMVFFVSALSLLMLGSYFLKKESADGRLLIWRCTLEMIKESPFCGHGIGGFRKCYMDYQANYLELYPDSQFAKLADNVQFPFNEYLSIVLSFGFWGLLTLLVIVGLLFYCYYKKPKFEKKTAMLLILGISVFSIFSYPFTWIIVSFCIYIIIKDLFCFKIPTFCGNILRSIIFAFCVFSLHSLCQRIKAEYQWYEASHLRNISDYEKLFPVLGKDPYFLYNYAVMLYSINHLEESLEVALLCSEQWADYDLELLLGNIYVRKKEYALAESYYRKASYMCPCRFIPLYQLFCLYRQIGNEDKAYSIARKINIKSVKVPSITVKHIKNKMEQYVELFDEN